MSNKLKKYSPGFKEAEETLRNKIIEEGGVNITPQLMDQFTEIEDEGRPITEDEFYTILDNLQNEGFKLYKISCVSNGKEIRGMMICDSNTNVVFVKQPENTESNKSAE